MHLRLCCARGSIVCCKMWYCQILDYDFLEGRYLPNTTSFTQMVWKSSTSVGFGVGVYENRVDRTKLDYYFLRIFSPAGNAPRTTGYENPYIQNVLTTKFDYKSYCDAYKKTTKSMANKTSESLVQIELNIRKHHYGERRD
ncbi:hypothetical protein ACOME3_004573 [Neoechinorhynchus agilis]